MNLDKRLGELEKKMGAPRYKEYREASRRHYLRFQNVRYFECFTFMEASLKANPDIDFFDESQWIKCTPVKVPGPYAVGMRMEDFEKDQQIINECARLHPELGDPSSQWAYGWSYWEMKFHFYDKVKAALVEDGFKIS